MKLNEVSMSKLFDLMIMVRVSFIFKKSFIFKVKSFKGSLMVGHHKYSIEISNIPFTSSR